MLLYKCYNIVEVVWVFLLDSIFFIDILFGWGYMFFIDILFDGKKIIICILMIFYLVVYFLIVFCKLCMEVFVRRNFLRVKNMREYF